MGDAGVFYGEHLLILHGINWDDSWLDDIRRRFPRLEISALKAEPTKPLEQYVPPDLLQRATVIGLNAMRHLPLPESIPNIKLVHTFSAGADGFINEPYIKDTDLPLTTSSGIHGPPITEWILMNWLVASKNYNTLYEAQRRHDWIGRQYSQFRQTDHVGKRVAILGYGSIGRQVSLVLKSKQMATIRREMRGTKNTVGRIATSLGAQVYAYTASAHDTPDSRKDSGYIVPGTGDPEGSLPVEWHHGTTKQELRRFLQLTKPDHAVIALPLTTATYNLFDVEEFELWSAAISSTTTSTPITAAATTFAASTAASATSPIEKQTRNDDGLSARKGFLTNISRGKIVNTSALITALETHQIRGAALDVTDPEPLPANHPLWDAPNVQISPHISATGQEYFVRALDVLRVNLERLEKGEQLVNLFRRRRGY